VVTPDVAPDVEPVEPVDEPVPPVAPLGDPVPVVDVPVVAPVALPVVTALPVPPGVPLFDTGTPDVWPDAEPVDEPAATLPLFAFPGGAVEHAETATTPAIPTDALIHFMVIFALSLKKENRFLHRCLHAAF
jgi:hypothetical protein